MIIVLGRFCVPQMVHAKLSDFFVLLDPCVDFQYKVTSSLLKSITKHEKKFGVNFAKNKRLRETLERYKKCSNFWVSKSTFREKNVLIFSTFLDYRVEDKQLFRTGHCGRTLQTKVNASGSSYCDTVIMASNQNNFVYN